jgi:hypothetical protein
MVVGVLFLFVGAVRWSVCGSTKMAGTTSLPSTLLLEVVRSKDNNEIKR